MGCGVRCIAAGWPCESPQNPFSKFSQIAHSSRLTTGALVQQSLELSSISYSKPSGNTREEGHVTQSGTILQSNDLVPQKSLQAPHTRYSQENSGITFSGPSRPRELGCKFGSANAYIDSPHEESTHRRNAEDIDRTAPARLSGGPSAPPWCTPCVLCSSPSFPLGPSLVTKTASHNMHAPWDTSSHEPRPEPRRGRSQASPFTTETGGKVTHGEQSYSKPTVVPERVPLRLEHTVSAADPPSFSSHILWKGTILALQLMRTSTTTLSKLRTKYLLRGGQQEQRKSSSTKTSFMIPGWDVIELNQVFKVTMLCSSNLFLGLPHQTMPYERSLTSHKEMIPARRILMTSSIHEKANNVV